MKKKIIQIIKLLKRKKLKISFAESCTGGMLSSSITSISGASKVFTMGLVTYSNQAKISILKVPKQIIQKHGAVSIQCCLSMVNNLSKISKSLAGEQKIYGIFFQTTMGEFAAILQRVSGMRIKHIRLLLALTRKEGATTNSFSPEFGMTLGEFCTAYVMTRQRSSILDI